MRSLRYECNGSGGRVRVVGHRGFPAAERPENTAAAVSAALAEGADGVEVDVRLTADGTLVCAHDPVVRTSSGRRLGVASSAVAQLREGQVAGGHRLATLAEVLDAARRSAGASVIVEAKPVPDVGTAVRTARALAAALAVAAGDVDLTVSSFSPVLLALIRGIRGGPAVRTAMLGAPSVPVPAVVRQARDAGHEEVHLPLSGLRRNPDAVQAARRLGLSVTCWTVNSRRDLRWVAGLGVDAVITDDVPGARAALGPSSVCAPIADVPERVAS